MSKQKPKVAVFFGGSQDNYDLSLETGRWVSQHLPRKKFEVIPVHVTHSGDWQVPLGSLPESGPTERVLDMFQTAIPSLPTAKALPRLLSREPDVFFTVVRGKGGDDGSMQTLAETVGTRAVGPSAAVCLTTSNKKTCAVALEPLALAPFGVTIPQSLPAAEAAVRVASDFETAVFIKPVTAEGSTGIRRIERAVELPEAIAVAQAHGDVLVQEARSGQELSVTVFRDDEGKVRVLPPTGITSHKTAFFDSLAKRKPGRVQFHSLDPSETLAKRATDLGKDIYTMLHARGMLTIDMIAHGDALDVLEVNTVPVSGEASPLFHQLKAAGVHPSVFVDSLVSQALA